MVYFYNAKSCFTLDRQDKAKAMIWLRNVCNPNEVHGFTTQAVTQFMHSGLYDITTEMPVHFIRKVCSSKHGIEIECTERV